MAACATPVPPTPRGRCEVPAAAVVDLVMPLQGRQGESHLLPRRRAISGRGPRDSMRASSSFTRAATCAQRTRPRGTPWRCLSPSRRGAPRRADHLRRPRTTCSLGDGGSGLSPKHPEWTRILAWPQRDIADLISEDNERARDLRQTPRWQAFATSPSADASSKP
jgi:hypothetical protein